MFRWVWMGLLGILTLALGMILFLLWISEGDREQYRELTQMIPLEKEQKSKQHRTGVRKDILLTEKGQRLHYQILSRKSDIVTVKNDDQGGLAEIMRGVSCAMQTKLIFSPKVQQEIRYFTAEKGTYYFGKNTFKAEQVDIYRYIVPGHQLITNFETYKPLVKGKAQSVRLKFGKETSFKAQHLKLNFQGSEGIL